VTRSAKIRGSAATSSEPNGSASLSRSTTCASSPTAISPGSTHARRSPARHASTAPIGNRTTVSGSLNAASPTTATDATSHQRPRHGHTTAQNAANIRYQCRLAALPPISRPAAGSSAMDTASTKRRTGDAIHALLATNTYAASSPTRRHVSSDITSGACSNESQVAGSAISRGAVCR
jgi:hypothetical protein